MSKQETRSRIREQRRKLTDDWVDVHSATIQSAVLELPEWRASDTVALYLAIAGEVKTDQLVAHCHRHGKRALVPAWDPDRTCYRPAWIHENAELKSGPMNVPQPVSPEWADLGCAGLIVVPGLAFDPRGGRIGYGGGNYDRLLSPLQSTPACRVAVAFDFQLLEEVETDDHDIRMDLVVTESKTIRCRIHEVKERMLIK